MRFASGRLAVGLGSISSQRLGVAAGLSIDNLHLLPVVRKFFAAIQAYHVGASQRSSRGAPLSWSVGNRETELFMPATEKHIEKICHKITAPPRSGWLTAQPIE